MVRHEPCPAIAPSPATPAICDLVVTAKANMKRALVLMGQKLEGSYSRPIRRRALHQASAQALRPQDARTLVANHPFFAPLKKGQTQKPQF